MDLDDRTIHRDVNPAPRHQKIPDEDLTALYLDGDTPTRRSLNGQLLAVANAPGLLPITTFDAPMSMGAVAGSTETLQLSRDSRMRYAVRIAHSQTSVEQGRQSNWRL